MIILFNNKFVPKSKAKVSILGSIGRGYGVFETLRTYDKKLPLAKKHIDRLFASAKKIDLKIKPTKYQILKMLEKVAKKSPHKTQRIKIMALEKDFIIISVTAKIDHKIYEGVKVNTIRMIRSLPEVKSISYLPSFLAHERAVKKGCFDALLLDKNNEVYEGAYSNLFWFEKNILCTRKNDILPGITRQIVLENSPYKTKFKNIKLKDLLKKDEIFLTQSITEIVPVIQIDNHIIGNGKIGEKTKRIIKEAQISR